MSIWRGDENFLMAETRLDCWKFQNCGFPLQITGHVHKEIIQMSIHFGREVIEIARSNDKRIALHMSPQDSAMFISCGGEYHHRNNIRFCQVVVQESSNYERNNDSDLAEEETDIVVWVIMWHGNHSMWMSLRKPDKLGFRVSWLNPEVGRIPVFIIECFGIIAVNRHKLVSIQNKTRERIGSNLDRYLIHTHLASLSSLGRLAICRLLISSVAGSGRRYQMFHTTSWRDPCWRYIRHQARKRT